MRIVHYKSVAVKLVIHAMLAKSDGFQRSADFHVLYHARRGHFVHSIGMDGLVCLPQWRERATGASCDFARTSTTQTG
jgi:hypothetical protein